MDQSSILYKHHINYIRSANQYSHYFNIDKYMEHYLSQDPNEIVVDFMASMTDDYFIDLYNYLFPNGSYKVDYIELIWFLTKPQGCLLIRNNLDIYLIIFVL